MLVNEFIDRTDYYPTAEEWDAINHTYTFDSELNKDEFCRLWVNMNKNKVDKQVSERRHKKEVWDTYMDSYEKFLIYSKKERRAIKESTREEYRRIANKNWDIYVQAREELMDMGILDKCNSINYRDY